MPTTIQRISPLPLRDGEYPTSQHYNKMVGQVNQRIIENSGEQSYTTPTFGAWDRLVNFFETFQNNSNWGGIFHLGLTRTLGQLYGLSTNIGDLNETQERKRANRAEVRRLWSNTARILFESVNNVSDIPARGWPLHTERPAGWQQYRSHFNDDGSNRAIPRGKFFAEMMAYFLCEIGRGSPVETANPQEYSIRSVAPDYERLLAEPQFRLANQHPFTASVIEDSNGDDRRGIIVDASTPSFNLETDIENYNTDPDNPLDDGKEYSIFELVGQGQYTLDAGLETERAVTVDDYLWVPEGAATIAKVGADTAHSVEVIPMEKRAIEYYDIILMAYSLVATDYSYPRPNAVPPQPDSYYITKQKDAFKHYFEESLLKINRATRGDGDPYSWQPDSSVGVPGNASQDLRVKTPLFQYMVQWAKSRVGLMQVTSDSGAKYNERTKMLKLNENSFHDDLVEGQRYAIKLEIGVSFYDANDLLITEGTLDRIFDGEYVIETETTTNDMGEEEVTHEYFFKIDTDTTPAENITFLTGDSTMTVISQPRYRWNGFAFTFVSGDAALTPEREYYYRVKPLVSTLFGNVITHKWLRLLPYADEDHNITQEKTDTRCYSYYFTDLVTYLRCIATGFSIPDEFTINSDEDAPDASTYEPDTTGTEVEFQKGISTQNRIKLIKDFTIERYAKVLDLDNFIIGADKDENDRDRFGFIPNTTYSREVLSKLNEAINLLRAIRIHGITANFRVSTRTYKYERMIDPVFRGSTLPQLIEVLKTGDTSESDGMGYVVPGDTWTDYFYPNSDDVMYSHDPTNFRARRGTLISEVIDERDFVGVPPVTQVTDATINNIIYTEGITRYNILALRRGSTPITPDIDGDPYDFHWSVTAYWGRDWLDVPTTFLHDCTIIDKQIKLVVDNTFILRLPDYLKQRLNNFNFGITADFRVFLFNRRILNPAFLGVPADGGGAIHPNLFSIPQSDTITKIKDRTTLGFSISDDDIGTMQNALMLPIGVRVVRSGGLVTKVNDHTGDIGGPWTRHWTDVDRNRTIPELNDGSLDVSTLNVVTTETIDRTAGNANLMSHGSDYTSAENTTPTNQQLLFNMA